MGQAECEGVVWSGRVTLFGGPSAIARGDDVDVIAQLAPPTRLWNEGDPRPREARQASERSGGIVDARIVRRGTGVLALVDRARERARERIDATFPDGRGPDGEGARPRRVGPVAGRRRGDARERARAPSRRVRDAPRDRRGHGRCRSSCAHRRALDGSPNGPTSGGSRARPRDPARLGLRRVRGGWRLHAPRGVDAHACRSSRVRSEGVRTPSALSVGRSSRWRSATRSSRTTSRSFSPGRRPPGSFSSRAPSRTRANGSRVSCSRSSVPPRPRSPRRSPAPRFSRASLRPFRSAGWWRTFSRFPWESRWRSRFASLHAPARSVACGGAWVGRRGDGRAPDRACDRTLVRERARCSPPPCRRRRRGRSRRSSLPSPGSSSPSADGALRFFSSRHRQSCSLELGARRAGRPHGVLRATFLDVGQGDAALVDLPDGSALLIDGGGLVGSPIDTGERVIAPILRARRRDALALAVLTHPHPDHFTGLATRARNDARWCAVGHGAGRARGRSRWLRCRSCRRFARGASRSCVRRTICGPHGSSAGLSSTSSRRVRSPRLDRDPNDNSIVLRIAFGDARVPLRRRRAKERKRGTSSLLRAGAAARRRAQGRAPREPNVVVARVPRGGRAAEWRSCPSGRRNRSVIRTRRPSLRSPRIGARVWRTDQDGAITVTTDGRSLDVASARGRR